MKTLARFVCALPLSLATGCADFDFSYVEDGTLPPIEVKDIGSNCETDDPVDEAIARVHVEQVDDECVITADVKVRAVAYEDIKNFIQDMGVGPSEFDESGFLDPEATQWTGGGICWTAAGPDDAGTAIEKCDYGPTVDAQWRLVGEDAWSPDPEFPTGATAQLWVVYVDGEPETLDAQPKEAPALIYYTEGDSFPSGQVALNHAPFFAAFEDAFFSEADVWSLLRARVTVPMSDVATFTEHEYQITFASQTYVTGHVERHSVLEAVLEWLLGGGDEE